MAPLFAQHRDAARVELAAGERRITPGIDAFREPQAHQQKLVGAFFAVEKIVRHDAMAVGLDAHQPRLWTPLGGDRMADTLDVQPPMRAGADAGIFVAAPVDQIVPAFRAGAGVIGNLVGRQAMRRADLLGDIVELARQRLVGRLQLAGGVQAEERRALLDGELVERQMFGGFRDRVLQFGGPHLRGLARAGIDQVERIAVEGLAGDRHRIERLARGVQPAQRLQRGVVQRLHAERYPVDAGRAVTGKARGLDAGRVGLERDFDIGGDAPVLADRIENGADGLRLHQGRRAAAEEDRRHLAARRARRSGFDLAGEGAREAFLVDRFMPDMAVEIAIGAFGQAERPVHIDAEGFFWPGASQDRSPPA